MTGSSYLDRLTIDGTPDLETYAKFTYVEQSRDPRLAREMLFACHLLSKVRKRDFELAADELQWLEKFLLRSALGAIEAFATSGEKRRGVKSRHDQRNYWLTMDYLVNQPSEKQLQQRWRVRGRTKDIVRIWRKKICDRKLAETPDLTQWREHIAGILQERDALHGRWLALRAAAAKLSPRRLLKGNKSHRLG